MWCCGEKPPDSGAVVIEEKAMRKPLSTEAPVAASLAASPPREAPAAEPVVAAPPSADAPPEAPPVPDEASGTTQVVVAKASSGDKLGLDTLARMDPPALKIKRVKEGLILKWNEENPEKAVRDGDIIVAVNGEAVSSTAMYAAIANSKTVALSIVRP
mmetsp:Transcript_19191/g.53990  ORF Transcript_19191/g.53990 Transcript_19191/m.53990 type:complete len:158 (-) Transcript_19191:133-606(-)